MKRKGLVSFLSLLVALLLPLSAMAQSAALDLLSQAKTDGKEIVTTLTFEPGTTLAADQAVADMSAATAIRLMKLSGGYGGFALSLQGEDVLTAIGKLDPTGLYVLNSVLGDKPVYFSWQDLSATISNAMRQNGTDEASIQQFTQGFEQGIAAVAAGGMPMQSDTAMTEAEIKQKIIASMGGDESFVNWINGIEAKKVTSQGEFTLGESDTADTKTEYLITKDDLTAMMDLPYIQQQMAKQIKQKDASLTDEQVTAQVADAVEQSKAKIAESNVQIPITVYTKGEDELVALEAKLSGLFTQSEPDTATVNVSTDAATVTATTDATAATATAATPAAPAQVDVDLQLTRKTLDSGKLTTFKMNAAKDAAMVFDMIGTLTADDKAAAGTLSVMNDASVKVLQMDLSADYADAKNIGGALQVTVNDGQTQSAFVVGLKQAVADTTIDTALSLSSGKSVDEILANADTALLGTLKIATLIQEDSGTFAALKEVSADTSLEPLKMTGEELAAYGTKIQNNAGLLMFTILGKLPQSVATLFTSSMSGQ
ncbi:MAG: hypothetical protein VB104_14020 [Candidatus Limiplasma sp.]|nr:hypothetical protein [Candidatus Limiplasma sp.]